MKRGFVAAVVLALVAAACGGDDAGDGDTSTSTTAASTTTTTAASTTTTTTGGGDGATTTTGSGGEAVFAVTEVVFGDGGYVVVTNVGSAAGDPGGHQLCQRPRYFRLDPVTLAPGESIWVAAGDGAGLDGAGAVAVVGAGGAIGELSADDGEIGLYRTGSFGSSDDIVDYVEWGSAGHGRASVAVAAGIWPDGAFVDPAGASAITTGGGDGATPADWQAG